MNLKIVSKETSHPVYTRNYLGGMLLRKHMPVNKEKTVGGLLTQKKVRRDINKENKSAIHLKTYLN